MDRVKMYTETERSQQKIMARVTKLSRGEATRRRIVEQSAPVFNRHGYSGTSMAELMDATGLEKGGIYRHFTSKQELAAAAFDYAWAAVNEPRERGLEDCPTSVGKLLLLVKNFVEQPQRTIPGGCPLLNTAIDSDDGNPVLRGKAQAALHQWRASIVDIVCEGQRSGELRADVDPTQVATILIATLEGAVMMSRMEKNRDPLFQAGKHLQEYLERLSAS
jgi:TetR/AcrR family transcriptional regulator, transcriptional repressor for nem operon